MWLGKDLESTENRDHTHTYCGDCREHLGAKGGVYGQR